MVVGPGQRICACVWTNLRLLQVECRSLAGLPTPNLETGELGRCPPWNTTSSGASRNLPHGALVATRFNHDSPTPFRAGARSSPLKGTTPDDQPTFSKRPLTNQQYCGLLTLPTEHVGLTGIGPPLPPAGMVGRTRGRAAHNRGEGSGKSLLFSIHGELCVRHTTRAQLMRCT